MPRGNHQKHGPKKLRRTSKKRVGGKKNNKKTLITSVILNGSRYSMLKEGTGVGDSGGMFNCIDPKTAKVVGVPGEIRVGHCCQCGSLYARTMQWQDWWLTTPVAEILSVSKDKTQVKFRTRSGSIYIATGF